MSNLPGISDKIQSVLVVAASISFTVGTYLSLQTQDPRYILFGGTLAAIGVGLKEILGVKAAPAK